eukprot:3608537-Pleurochrysis_carterae.AAC.3
MQSELDARKEAQKRSSLSRPSGRTNGADEHALVSACGAKTVPVDDAEVRVAQREIERLRDEVAKYREALEARGHEGEVQHELVQVRMSALIRLLGRAVRRWCAAHLSRTFDLLLQCFPRDQRKPFARDAFSLALPNSASRQARSERMQLAIELSDAKESIRRTSAAAAATSKKLEQAEARAQAVAEELERVRADMAAARQQAKQAAAEGRSARAENESMLDHVQACRQGKDAWGRRNARACRAQ